VRNGHWWRIAQKRAYPPHRLGSGPECLTPRRQDAKVLHGAIETGGARGVTGVTAGLRSSWRAWRLGVRYVLSILHGRENSPPVSGTNRTTCPRCGSFLTAPYGPADPVGGYDDQGRRSLIRSTAPPPPRSSASPGSRPGWISSPVRRSRGAAAGPWRPGRRSGCRGCRSWRSRTGRRS